MQQIWASPCLLCGEHTKAASGVCLPCRQDLPWHNADVCQRCALPLPNSTTTLCGQCINLAPAFTHTHAVFRYAFPINKILQAYKYQERLTIAQFFAHSCLETQSRPSLASYLIPMPLHPSRLQSRGFNQSLEIARQLSRAWDIPLDKHSCHRIKNTPPQASLTLKARVKNVTNAFACRGNFHGQHVLVIDDVMTTGASLNELSKTLLNAGAASVSGLVMARTIPHQSG